MDDVIDDARTEILRRIRAARPDTIAAAAPLRDYDLALPNGQDRVALFAERVADYRATVVTTGRAGLAREIGAALRSNGLKDIAVPKDIDPSWLSKIDMPTVRDDPPLTHRELDVIDCVLTGCAVAIAETGTIVLDGGTGQGRRALSLLPDFHMCVVFAKQIVGTVPEAIGRLDATRPQTWISGPSATSDIELQRVEGVHGPRGLHVLLVQP